MQTLPSLDELVQVVIADTEIDNVKCYTGTRGVVVDQPDNAVHVFVRYTADRHEIIAVYAEVYDDLNALPINPQDSRVDHEDPYALIRYYIDGDNYLAC